MYKLYIIVIIINLYSLRLYTFIFSHLTYVKTIIKIFQLNQTRYMGINWIRYWTLRQTLIYFIWLFFWF